MNLTDRLALTFLTACVACTIGYLLFGFISLKVDSTNQVSNSKELETSNLDDTLNDCNLQETYTIGIRTYTTCLDTTQANGYINGRFKNKRKQQLWEDYNGTDSDNTTN